MNSKPVEPAGVDERQGTPRAGWTDLSVAEANAELTRCGYGWRVRAAALSAMLRRNLAINAINGLLRAGADTAYVRAEHPDLAPFLPAALRWSGLASDL